ncbi:MAG: hypothetical protein PHS79_04735 [Patescibacteria group bacterium]|nr:hypothetical protein [Patescibacteria group bacterium]
MNRFTENQIRRTATSIVKWINSRWLTGDNKWRKGGWLCILDPDGKIFFHEPIGEVPAEKDEKYKALAAEKALRLHEHPEHNMSWQSRDPDKNQWGGAARHPDGWIISFSGFSEFWDEYLVLALFQALEMHDEISRTASTSIIDYYQKSPDD